MIPDEFCPICGRVVDVQVVGELWLAPDQTAVAAICPKCGDVTSPFFDGMDVDWDDLDHSHDDELVKDE